MMVILKTLVGIAATVLIIVGLIGIWIDDELRCIGSCLILVGTAALIVLLVR